jgi:disulfide bond formation protein DsbB
MSLVTLMSLGIAGLDVVVVLALLGLCTKQFRAPIIEQVRRYALLLVLLLSLGSALGSLYIQYGMNLPPCILCWWQRIFMYPMVLISGIAFFKNTRFAEIADYVLGLSILGALVSLYQHLLQMMPANPLLVPCDATGDCAVRSVFELGFVTLPWMALTVFVALALIAFVSRQAEST